MARVRDALRDKVSRGYDMTRTWEAYEANKSEMRAEAEGMTTEELQVVIVKALRSAEWRPMVIALVAEDELEARNG